MIVLAFLIALLSIALIAVAFQLLRHSERIDALGWEIEETRADLEALNHKTHS
jgi:Flp pilus assembly protein TadB